ncbi:MAG: prolipoprotein diacylglyceryl transferase [Clostridia bacterium]|nr:prolipoprotein diacylglyceryl transferase [Clostridia bacterium]
MEFEDRIWFYLFQMPVTGYAVCVVLAAAAGLGLFLYRGSRRRLDTDALWGTALLALPLGLLGARLFYCLARFSLYEEIGLENMLRLWDGGYALWGAAGGAALAAVIGTRCGKQPLAPLLDALAPAGALTIALARFGEFFSGEGCGPYVEDEAFQFFPLAVYDGYYEEWKWAVFMLEGLAALAILAALLRKQRKAGDTARLFLLLYSACQILLESLRRDSYLRWLFVKVSQLTAAIVIVMLMAAATVRWARRKDARRMTGKGLLMRWLAAAASVGLIIALEFAVDDKIWHELPIWGIYGLMACACAVIGVSAHQTVFRSLKTE